MGQKLPHRPYGWQAPDTRPHRDIRARVPLPVHRAACASNAAVDRANSNNDTPVSETQPAHIERAEARFDVAHIVHQRDSFHRQARRGPPGDFGAPHTNAVPVVASMVHGLRKPIGKESTLNGG